MTLRRATPGSSFIRCNNSVAAPCVVANPGELARPPRSKTFRLSAGNIRQPAAGSIGLQWSAGYNLVITNVQVANFNTCAKFGPVAAAGIEPISLPADHQRHDLQLPEALRRRGWHPGALLPRRPFGAQDLNFNSANDFFYGTQSSSTGAGGGPNSACHQQRADQCRRQNRRLHVSLGQVRFQRQHIQRQPHRQFARGSSASARRTPATHAQHVLRIEQHGPARPRHVRRQQIQSRRMAARKSCLC